MEFPACDCVSDHIQSEYFLGAIEWCLLGNTFIDPILLPELGSDQEQLDLL